MQVQDLPVVLSVDKAKQLLHEDHLLDLTIEEGRLHVHVVDHPREMSGDAQQEPHELQPHHRREHLLKVDALFLDVSFCHQMSLVLHYRPLFILLELEDPLEVNGTVTLG
jgi:hypothetical protein